MPLISFQVRLKTENVRLRRGYTSTQRARNSIVLLRLWKFRKVPLESTSESQMATLVLRSTDAFVLLGEHSLQHKYF